VRTLAIATQYTVLNARVVGVPPPGEKDPLTTLEGEVRGDLFASRDHCYAASTLARTWMLFPDPGRFKTRTVTTRDGEPGKFLPNQLGPIVNSDAGLPPLLIAAVAIVVVAIYSAAVCYVGQLAAEVIDRKLTQDALTTRMLTTQAHAVALVDDHSERERAAGHPLPWSPQELQLLDSLLEAQRAIALRTNSALPNPFMGALEKAEEVGKAAVGAAAAGAAGFGMLAAVVGGAYVLTR
jgi:hypothetical protein